MKYGAFVQATGRHWDEPLFSQTDRDPAVNVSWHDAHAYVEWLSETSLHEYRLPSEAEWEYAARAGTTTTRYWGEEKTGEYAHVDQRGTAPVGTLKPNAFGLHDMLGNVWEWVEDCWHDNYEGAPLDGSAWTSGDPYYRVVRGGCWVSRPSIVSSVDRVRVDATVRDNRYGFRVVRILSST